MNERLASFYAVWEKREYRAFLFIMVLTSLALSASAPLVSLYLVDRLHLALALVGLFFASQALPGFVMGLLIGRWSDRWRSRFPSIRIAAVWVAIGWLVFGFSPWTWLTLATGAVFLWASGIIMGQVFAATHDVMTRDGEKHPGLINTTIRTGWSFGYVFGPLLGSLLAAQVGFQAAFAVTACLYLLCLLPIYRLRVDVRAEREEAVDSGRQENTLVYIFTGLCALVLCGTAIKNTYLPIDVTAHLGGSIRIYGTIVAVSPIVELVLMPLSGVLAVRLPMGRLIVAGLLVALVEYLLLSSSNALWQIYAIQAMDAWVIAVVMGLGITYAQGLSPERPGLVSGIFSSSFSIAIVVGNVVGSAAVPWLGVPHVFLIPAAFCAISLLTFLMVDRASARGRERRAVVESGSATG